MTDITTLDDLEAPSPASRRQKKASGDKNDEMEQIIDATDGGKTLNPNSYATRKTVAQGMLDIALLTANASQLRYVLSLGQRHENYQLMVGLIVTSLVLQILVGILFLIIGALNINRVEQQQAANILNNIITLMLFVITLVNVVLNSFGLNHDASKLYDKAR